jgi:sterol 3beta-glucosyltransferase
LRITILTIGSRGDVQPYIALGLGLQRAGHEVTLATHEPFASFVQRYGLRFRAIAGNPREAMEGEIGQAWLKTRDPVSFIRDFRRLVSPLMERGLQDTWEVCRGSEAIVFSSLGIGAYHVAERLQVPAFMAALQPQGPTRAFPSPMVPPGTRLGGWYNYATHAVFDLLYTLAFRDKVNAWRADTLGLAPWPIEPSYRVLRRHGVPVLFGISPLVVPPPPDWPPSYHVTGYWFLDTASGAWQPPHSLVEFIGAGPPPVYVGFGSMATRNADRLTTVAVQALRATGQRGVLLSGWAGLGRSCPAGDILVVDDVPHDWLFPRMTAVVHHGGAGTTAAGLRAGVPGIITPVFGDQPFWGHRVASLGVGPQPVPQRELSAERLAAAIRAATSDGEMRARAADLGRRIRAEDGVTRAVEIIQRHLGLSQPRRLASAGGP